MKHDIFDFIDLFLALENGETGWAVERVRSWHPDRFTETCRRHQVAGYAYLLLENLQIDHPELLPAVARLRGDYVEQWAANTRLAWRFLELVAALDEASVPFALLKGLYLADRYYGAPDRRPIGDIDILVARENLSATAEALESLDLKPVAIGVEEAVRSSAHLYHVEYSAPGLRVEVHWALRTNPTFRIATDEILARAEPWVFQGRTIRVPPPDVDLLLQLLGLHTDVSLGEVLFRNFLDIHKVCARLQEVVDWSRYLDERELDGTLKLCVNTLAMFLVTTRQEPTFEELARVVNERRELLVGQPDRAYYREVLSSTSLIKRKDWPFRQFDTALAKTATWWLRGLPARARAHGASLRKRARTGPRVEPLWPSGNFRSKDIPGSPALERDYDVSPALLREGRLRFGSLATRLFYSRAAFRSMIEELFRLRVSDPEAAPSRSRDELELFVFDVEPERFERYGRFRTGRVDLTLQSVVELRHGIAAAEIHPAAVPNRIYLSVLTQGQSEEHILHSLMIVLYKSLFVLGRLQLHAAAIDYHGAVNLFVGEKGAGKSTISLFLGRAGGTILAEDHVFLHRTGQSFLVSGCDFTMRLTETTERHFFDAPLEIEPRLHAGVPKKEVDLRNLDISTRPFQDEPVRRVFFPRLGHRLARRRLSPAEGITRLLDFVHERHRLADEDSIDFLAFFRDLAAQAEMYDLELSSDLADLKLLAPWLTGQAEGEIEESAGALDSRR